MVVVCLLVLSILSLLRCLVFGVWRGGCSFAMKISTHGYHTGKGDGDTQNLRIPNKKKPPYENRYKQREERGEVTGENLRRVKKGKKQNKTKKRQKKNGKKREKNQKKKAAILASSSSSLA